MQAIQYHSAHPALIRHHRFFQEESEERELFRTPEKKTKPINLSPSPKPKREEFHTEEHLQARDILAVRLRFWTLHSFFSTLLHSLFPFLLFFFMNIPEANSTMLFIKLQNLKTLALKLKTVKLKNKWENQVFEGYSGEIGSQIGFEISCWGRSGAGNELFL